MSVWKKLAWIGVAALGTWAVAELALSRGEQINALWIVIAGFCAFSISYRFYSKWLATKVLVLNEERATPAVLRNDNKDYVPTNRWMVFGHHFAAIAGPGPLVGPVLAAQFGYLPGTLWILVGSVFGGCVQDFVILLFSVRRDGKSLTEMAKQEIGHVAGLVAYASVIAILVILLAVCALVVVNALKQSPWGTFTIAMTIPIAFLMGVYLRRLRPGRVVETSALGFILVLAAIWGGQWVSLHPAVGNYFTLGAPGLAMAIILYGFAASALPVWLLLAPRDYLSTFVKLGTIGLLAFGIVLMHPTLRMPGFTKFIDGTGPVFAGKVFPFAFITIACGAISGFHSLISSGTTPKLIRRETDARMVGYGAMLCESMVAIMATVAACVLEPGTYFAINSPAGVAGAVPEKAATTISSWGFPVTAEAMHRLAQNVGEITLFNRTGGAPAFAVGMAHIFSGSLGGQTLMALWYHFALMFEALFILTVLDAGTRVGRFMLQDALGHVWKPMGRTGWYPSALATSAIVVAAWGYFLWQGVRDPLGGINSLWPLFGISNQLLAAVALCVATTIIIKKHRARYALVTLAPLVWLVGVTFTASWHKIFDPDPRIGFLAQAQQIAAAGGNARLVFNNRLDAVVSAILVVMVSLLLIESMRQWMAALSGRKPSSTTETPFVVSRLAEERG
jgi:carbon starvation protein